MKERSGRKAGMSMDTKVFGYFKHFTSDNDEERVNIACNLVEFLCSGQTSKSQNGTNEVDQGETVESKTAETAYALKRLVRGVGSMQNDSRIGFFTALVGLLERLRGNDAECPSVTELFVLVKSELTESGDGDDEEDGEDGKRKMNMALRVGKIFICGAIIKSGLIDDASESELQKVLKTLKKCMHEMLTPLVYTFLNDLAGRLDAAKFSKVFWPLFEPVLNVPKESHTIDSTFFLLQLSIGPHKKLMNRKYFERNFGVPKLLHEDNFPFLSQLLFSAGSRKVIDHPFFECLLQELNKQNLMVPFWRDAVVPVLGETEEGSKPKHRDFIVLRLVVSILKHLEDYTLLPEVLQTEFVKFLGNALKNRTQHSEEMRELYQNVCTGLLQTYPKLQDETVRVETFRRLMQAPGKVLIDKYANCKLLYNLLITMTAESLRTVAGELKTITLDESTGTNGERSYAANLLQKLLSLRQMIAQSGDKGQADAWHQEVVKFFLTLGVFYSADGVNVLKGSKGERSISAELAKTMRGLFFNSLEHHHSKLSIERTFLLSIVRHVDEVLRAHGTKCLRTALTEEQMACWSKMFATVTNESASGKTPKGKTQSSAAGQTQTVFHILLMHMGLHLFSDPEVACSSIVELECVMKRIEEKAKQRRKSNGEAKAVNGIKSKKSTELTIEQEPAEPEWIEVVVDLFLNLLSQNSHLLRKVISHLFPHLSGEITLTALHQILSVINLKDKTNPLTAPGEEESDEIEGEEDGDEKDSSGEEEDSDGDSESEKNDDEEDDEDIMGDEEEEENISDVMRDAIQKALGGANPDTDTESIDLDELDDEQGRQLDEALTAAFRAFREKKAARKRKGPTKAEKQIDTVLTHFRMRVLDLVDAYLKHEPDMMLCLELMLYIFEMLPVALREESKYGTILTRYNNIFTTLIQLKKFKRDAEDVRMDQLEQMLRDLIEKVAKGVAFPERNEYLLKACHFIIICSQALSKKEAAVTTATDGPNAVEKMFGELLVEFITKRNPSLAFSVFQSLFRLHWSGLWHLTEKLVQGGLKVGSVRAIRRIQTLQLLRDLLQNRRQLNMDPARSAVALRSICAEGLTPYVEQLEAAVVGGEGSIGQNELYELLLVLIAVHRLSSNPAVSGSKGKKVANKQQSLLKWDTIGNQIQSMRRFVITSQALTTYRLFCQRLHLTPISNEGLPSLKENAESTVNDEKHHTTNGGNVLAKKGKGKKQKTMNGGDAGEENEEDATSPQQKLANGHVANGDSAEEDTQHEQDATAERKANRKRKKEKALANGHDGTNGSAHEEDAMEVADEDAREKRKRKKEKAFLVNGHDGTNGSAQEEEAVTDVTGDGSQDAREKRKRKKDGEAPEDSKQSKKEKRRRKEALMQAASEGMEECSFARVITIE